MRGNVARRFLALFLICALIPISALAVVSYQQVTGHLREQSEQRLHQASKAMGMVVLGRIVDLEALLPRLSADAPGSSNDAAPPAYLRERFRAVAIGKAGAPPRTLWGRPIAPLALDRDAREHLANGGTLLRARPGPDGAADVLLVQRLRPSDAESSLVLAAVEVSYLVGAAQVTVPLGADFCILGSSGLAIGCSTPATPTFPPDAVRRMAAGRSGSFEWRAGGTPQLAHHWSIFLKARFSSPPWTMVLGEPTSVVFAPIASFRVVFPLTVLLAVLLAVLIGRREIRRRLIPLRRLHEGTRRIGRQELDVRIDVESGDEFEELAAAFNTMTGRLRGQFDSLEKLIDIDRVILSAEDESGIISTLLYASGDLYPSDVVSVMLADPERPETLRVRSRSDRSGTSGVIEVEGFTRSERKRLELNPVTLTLGPGDGLPGYLGPPLTEGEPQLVLLPIFVNRELTGVVVFAHRDSSPDPDQLPYARQLVDQAAVALSNVRTLEKNRFLAYYDRLTGLPNRLMFKERLRQAIDQAERYEGLAAICLLDLDDFKRINDTLGHEAGDGLLSCVADRLAAEICEADVARLGGDEFAMLLPSLSSSEAIAGVVRRALEVIQRPVSVGGREVVISASAGIAVHPDDGTSVDGLIQSADSALHHAKDAGPGTYRFFTQSMNARAVDRLNFEMALRHALEREELRVFYQPVVELDTLDPVGLEALVRWQSPELGLVSPERFVTVAEELGLIGTLDRWVLRTVCSQIEAWRRAGLPPLRVAVNVSPLELREPGLAASVKSIVRETGADPGRLGIELTERALLEPGSEATQTLDELRAMGARISVDDFGTGYSSLGYLKHFPIDVLKIDRCFVQGLPDDENDASITRAIVAMAHGLGLRVVAEGVETEAQLAFLRSCGCDRGQGYLFAEPLPADAAAKWQAVRAFPQGLSDHASPPADDG